MTNTVIKKSNMAFAYIWTLTRMENNVVLSHDSMREGFGQSKLNNFVQEIFFCKSLNAFKKIPKSLKEYFHKKGGQSFKVFKFIYLKNPLYEATLSPLNISGKRLKKHNFENLCFSILFDQS